MKRVQDISSCASACELLCMPQAGRDVWLPQFVEGARLNLAGAFACDTEAASHAVQRLGCSLLQPIAQCEHDALALREHLRQDLLRLLSVHTVQRLLLRWHCLVTQHVAEVRRTA